jgi:hypothetical protein
MRVKPESWFGTPKPPRKVRVVQKARKTNNTRRKPFLRKQFYKEGEVELSERLHRMGYRRTHIFNTVKIARNTLNMILRDPWKMKMEHVLCLSVLLGEDFFDVLYEVGFECKKKSIYKKTEAATKRLEKAIEKNPYSESSEYKGESLRD